MDPTISVAIISAAASIIVAAVTFVLTKRAQRKDVLQQRKLAHYQDLLSGISDLAIDDIDKTEANLKFARAVNTIALVAPQSVISALMDFHDEVKFSNPNKSVDNHDKKLKKLLLEMRKSLELPFEDDPSTFNFHLVGFKPKK
jgi:hypothetical protein